MVDKDSKPRGKIRHAVSWVSYIVTSILEEERKLTETRKGSLVHAHT